MLKMILCSDCFCDLEIKGRIDSHLKPGDCHICRKQSTYIYDTNVDNYLNGIFDKVISIYTAQESLPEYISVARQSLIKDELIKNWRIFNNLNSEQVYNIFRELSSELYVASPELFDTPVANMQLYDTQYLKENSILKEYSWNDFVTALKHENRFHTNHINTEILRVFCSYIRKLYKKGECFFRGRISSKSGYNCSEMSAPPNEKVMEGRANSMGIRRLYLADDVEILSNYYS
jgi:hypothetical protein